MHSTPDSNVFPILHKRRGTRRPLHPDLAAPISTRECDCNDCADPLKGGRGLVNGFIGGVILWATIGALFYAIAWLAQP